MCPRRRESRLEMCVNAKEMLTCSRGSGCGRVGFRELCCRTHGGACFSKGLRGETRVSVPTVMWVKALDLLLQKLQSSDIHLNHIVAISGSAQQHGESSSSPALPCQTKTQPLFAICLGNAFFPMPNGEEPHICRANDIINLAALNANLRADKFVSRTTVRKKSPIPLALR